MSPELLGMLPLKWSEFIPETIRPTAKQIAFLMLPHREALFGGRAGCGKSISLLAGAVQYADVPGYAGIIFRRTTTEAALAGSILDLALEWWGNDSRVKFDKVYNTFTFLPYQTTLTIGYLKNELDHERYKGSEVQYIAFDELTDFLEQQVRFLNRSLRRKKNLPIPLRIRAATNPGGVGHCVPYGEVLTPQGWKDIKEFKVGDPVFTVSPSGMLLSTVVDQVHVSEASTIKVIDERGFHLACTDNHQVAFVSKRKTEYSDYSLREFSKLPGQACILRTVSWTGTNPEFFCVPTVTTRKRRLNQPKKLAWNDYAEFMGWYLSEGHTVDRDKAFGISQTKSETRPILEACLKRCGFVYSSDAKGFTVYCPDWYAYLTQFGKATDKHIPKPLLSSSTESLQSLFKSLMLGDGHSVSANSGQYYTVSKQLNDDVQEVVAKLGFISRMTSRHRKGDSTVKERQRCYELSFKKTKSGGSELLTGNHVYDVETTTKRKTQIQTVLHNAPVYCLGIKDTHTFLIRQNGSVWVSGNSWVKARYLIHRDPATREWVGGHSHRPFISASIADNPHVDQAQYNISLNEMEAIDRLRMKEGDWDAAETARYKQSFFNNRWRVRGSYFNCPDIGKSWHRLGVEIFFTLDCAASYHDGTGQTSFRVNDGRSFTVCSVWGRTHDGYCLMLDQVRVAVEVPEIPRIIIPLAKRYRPAKVICDATGVGKGVYQLLEYAGLPIHPIYMTSDKVQNSACALARCAAGKFILPQEASWLDVFFGEVCTWTGARNEIDDQVDTLSTAGNYMQECMGMSERTYDPDPQELPSIVGAGWSNGMYSRDMGSESLLLPYLQ